MPIWGKGYRQCRPRILAPPNSGKEWFSFLPSQLLEMGPAATTTTNSPLPHPFLGTPGLADSSAYSFLHRPGGGGSRRAGPALPTPTSSPDQESVEFTGADAQSPPAWCFWSCFWPEVVEWGEGWYRCGDISGTGPGRQMGRCLDRQICC